MLESIAFYSFAFLISLCSVMVVSARHPVTAAIFLVLNLFLLAGVFAMQGAAFVAAIQVLVYAGAILVLFMFVIMLLNLEPEALQGQKMRPSEILGAIVTAAGLTYLIARTTAAGLFSSEALPAAAANNTHEVGMTLFRDYLWPFELASILILLAVVASVMISRRPSPSRT